LRLVFRSVGLGFRVSERLHRIFSRRTHSNFVAIVRLEDPSAIVLRYVLWVSAIHHVSSWLVLGFATVYLLCSLVSSCSCWGLFWYQVFFSLLFRSSSFLVIIALLCSRQVFCSCTRLSSFHTLLGEDMGCSCLGACIVYLWKPPCICSRRHNCS